MFLMTYRFRQEDILNICMKKKKMPEKGGQALFQTLSSNLKERIKKESYLSFIENVSVFRNSKFSSEFLNALCNTIEEYIFAPEEIITKVFLTLKKYLLI